MVLANIWKQCPNRGFIDVCVSKVWYQVHTIRPNKNKSTLQGTWPEKRG